MDLHIEDFHPEISTPAHMGEGVRGLGLISGYAHGETLSEGDAAALAQALGVNASFREDNGRILPQYANTWGFGLIGGKSSFGVKPNTEVEFAIQGNVHGNSWGDDVWWCNHNPRH